MPGHEPLPPPLATPRRVLAGLLAFFVFGLTLAAQSPLAHAWLHKTSKTACIDHADKSASAPDGDTETGCPVTLFAQGLTLPINSPELIAPGAIPTPALPNPPLAPATNEPERLHPPAHAPPARA